MGHFQIGSRGKIGMPEKMLDGDCTAVDVWFGNSAVDVIDTGGWVASQNLAGLPDLAGYGAVRRGDHDINT